jgi:hypothetical protein
MGRGMARCLSGAHPVVRLVLIRYAFYCFYKTVFCFYVLQLQSE